MLKLKQRRTPSQNFLHDPHLVKKLVRKSSIGPNDIVLEIGPGKGIITRELIKVSKHVMAVEFDKKLVEELLSQFKNSSTLTIFNQDFLKFPLPSFQYKVFSNLPFYIEGKVIRRLLNGKNPPQEIYIVVRKEAGERWSGSRKEGEFSLLHKPWFEMGVVHYFKRFDFKPRPRVNSAMLKITKREKPLIRDDQRREYKRFIRAGFGGGRRIDQNLSSFFTRKQLSKISKRLNFSTLSKPSDLSFNQWLDLFLESEMKEKWSSNCIKKIRR